MERDCGNTERPSGERNVDVKSTDNLFGWRKQLWNTIRFLVPPRARWFYEGHPQLRGQLWYAERKLLHETVRAYRPVHCFEIGTWRGGGSTLFISQALQENGNGTLHTVEINREFYDDAVKNYSAYLPRLVPHVTFHLGDYRSIYAQVLGECKEIDFLILDGAEDGAQTLEQYNFFLPYIKAGMVLMVHDWFTEKTRLLKPILENADEWEIRTLLVPPVSLGFMLAVRKSFSPIALNAQ